MNKEEKEILEEVEAIMAEEETQQLTEEELEAQQKEILKLQTKQKKLRKKAKKKMNKIFNPFLAYQKKGKLPKAINSRMLTKEVGSGRRAQIRVIEYMEKNKVSILDIVSEINEKSCRLGANDRTYILENFTEEGKLIVKKV